MDAAVAGEFAPADPPANSRRAAAPVDAGTCAEVHRGIVFLKSGVTLPTQICVKSGRPADRMIRHSLRDPLDPTTWFGKRETIGLGLTRKHYENLMIARALTWTGLSVAILILSAGLFSLNLGMTIAGALMALAMSPIRAVFPVWVRTQRGSADVELHGAGRRFLDQLS